MDEGCGIRGLIPGGKTGRVRTSQRASAAGVGGGGGCDREDHGGSRRPGRDACAGSRSGSQICNGGERSGYRGVPVGVERRPARCRCHPAGRRHQAGGMRQKVYKELAEMERIDAAALQARAWRNGPSGVELFRQLLDSYAIAQLPGESLAETVARAAGMSARELKDLLWERAQAIDLCSSGMAISY